MKLKISELHFNENNPRIIKDGKFKKLVKSIKEFPEMLELRPIVVDENNIILGGNMRTRACIEAGIKEVPVKIITSEVPKDLMAATEDYIPTEAEGYPPRARAYEASQK